MKTSIALVALSIFSFMLSSCSYENITSQEDSSMIEDESYGRHLPIFPTKGPEIKDVLIEELKELGYDVVEKDSFNLLTFMNSLSEMQTINLMKSIETRTDSLLKYTYYDYYEGELIYDEIRNDYSVDFGDAVQYEIAPQLLKFEIIESSNKICSINYFNNREAIFVDNLISAHNLNIQLFGMTDEEKRDALNQCLEQMEKSLAEAAMNLSLTSNKLKFAISALVYAWRLIEIAHEFNLCCADVDRRCK